MARPTLPLWTELEMMQQSLITPADIADARADVESSQPFYAALLRAPLLNDPQEILDDLHPGND